MTIAVITLALALVTAVGAIVWFAKRLDDASSSEAKARSRELTERETAERYLTERDQSIKDHAATDQLKRALQLRVNQLQQEVIRVHDETTRQIAERLRSANVVDVIRIVDELLSAPLSRVSPAPPTKTGGDGGG